MDGTETKRSIAIEYTHRLNLYQVNDFLDIINQSADKEECAEMVSDILESRGYRERFIIGKDGRAKLKWSEE